MYLTKEEERILDGEHGEAAATAMGLLVAVGDVFGAEKLISVKSAQISGISYKTIGDAGLEFVESFARSGAKTSIHATMNPAGMDLDNWVEMGIPSEFALKQTRVISALKEIGVSPTCTCTPYLLTRKPSWGEHLAWAESSAVIYANSILGARSNREGGPTALASAIIGKTPLYGLHLNENRVPTVEVSVNLELMSELDFSLLGYFVGKSLPSDVPLVNLHGARGKANNTCLKALGAGMATSGGQALYHVAGLTPEWNISGKCSPRERISVDRSDLEHTKEALSTESRPEHICLGCPHCDIDELERICKLSKDRQFTKQLMVFTSRYVWNLAKKRRYLKGITDRGGKVIRDTCMVVAPLEDLGITRVLTNSTKAAHYLPPLCHAKVDIRSLEECLDYAANGD